MEVNVNDARKEVRRLYKELSPIVTETVRKNCKDVDSIIEKIRKNLENLDNSEIQTYMLQLSVECYYLSERKEKANIMQDIAVALNKSSYAEAYNSYDGTQGAKANQAIIDTVDKEVVKMLQTRVSDSLKGKLDEAHRMCNTLSNVLISRNAENKLKITERGVNTNNSSNSDEEF